VPDAPPDWLCRVAKAGYAGKGLMYACIAALAVLAALGYASDPEGSRGTMQMLAGQPFGRVVIVLLAAGLGAYSVWRWFEVAFNPGGASGGAGALVRFAFAVSAAIHSWLTYSAVRIAMGSGGSETDSASGQTAKESWTQTALGWPAGEWIVGAVGVLIAAVALRQFVRAYRAGWIDSFDTDGLSDRARRALVGVGRVGLGTRGVAFGLIGGFVLAAAWRRDPEKAHGLDGSLDALLGQPFGSALLVAIGIGLVCFAVHCWAAARLRSFAQGDSARVDYMI
jgi:hypothetical protein